jgi:hypothetical protein
MMELPSRTFRMGQGLMLQSACSFLFAKGNDEDVV